MLDILNSFKKSQVFVRNFAQPGVKIVDKSYLARFLYTGLRLIAVCRWKGCAIPAMGSLLSIAGLTVTILFTKESSS